MEEKFKTYMNEISVPEVVQNRVEQIIDELKALYDNYQVKDIFMSQVRQDSSIAYTSLWAFGDNFCTECKNFLNSDDYDITFLSNNVQYFNIVKTKFPTMNVQDDSYVQVFAQLDKVSCTLTAVGRNCINAVSLAKKYFLSNAMC